MTSYEAIAVAVAAFAVPWRPTAHYGFVAAASVFTLAGLLAVPLATDRAGLAGAVAFAWLIALVGKPLAWNARVQLHLEASRVRRLRDALERSSRRDQLTGLETRRALDTHLAHLARRRAVRSPSRSSGSTSSSITDRFGPLAADQAVREVAAALRSAIRDIDDLFLYSADEFVLVLDPADTTEFAAVVQRVRAEVEALGLPNPSSSAGLLTVSVGTVDVDLPATAVELEAAIAQSRRQMHVRRHAAPSEDSAGVSGQSPEEPVTG